MGLILLFLLLCVLRTTKCCSCSQEEEKCFSVSIPPQGQFLKLPGGGIIIAQEFEGPQPANVLRYGGEMAIEKLKMSVIRPGTEESYMTRDRRIWKAFQNAGLGQTQIVRHGVTDETEYQAMNVKSFTESDAIPIEMETPIAFYNLSVCTGRITVFQCGYGEISPSGCPSTCKNQWGNAVVFNAGTQSGVGVYHPEAEAFQTDISEITSSCMTTGGYVKTGMTLDFYHPLEKCLPGTFVDHGFKTPKGKYVTLEYQPTMFNTTRIGDRLYSYTTPEQYGLGGFWDFAKCCGFFFGIGGDILEYYADGQTQGSGDGKILQDEINKLIQNINYNQGLTNAAITELRGKVNSLQIQVAANTARIEAIEQIENITDQVEAMFRKRQIEILVEEGWCMVTNNCLCPPNSTQLPTEIPTYPPLPVEINVKDWATWGVIAENNTTLESFATWGLEEWLYLGGGTVGVIGIIIVVIIVIKCCCCC